MRRAPLAFALLLSCAASAQTFRPAGGPWTRDHTLVGSAPDGRIFAAVGPRLGVTADGGRTWTVVAETGAPRRLVADGDALLGAYSNGVRRSTDGGATWTPWGLDGQDVLDVVVDGNAFALAYDSSARRTLYRRAVDGSWAAVPFPADFPTYATLTHFDAAGGTLAIAGRVSVCQGSSVQSVYLRSRDGGQSWSQTNATGNPSGVAVGANGEAWFASANAPDCLDFQLPGGLSLQRANESAAVRTNNGYVGGVSLDGDDQPVTHLPGIVSSIRLGTVLWSSAGLIAESLAEEDCGFDPPCSYVSNSGLFVVRNGQTVQNGFDASAIYALALVGGQLSVAADGAVVAPNGDGWTVQTRLGDTRDFVPVPWMTDGWLAVAPDRPFDPAYVGGGGFGYPVSALLSGDGTEGTPLLNTPTVSADAVAGRIVSASCPFDPGVYVSDASNSGWPTATLEDVSIGTVEGVDGLTVYAGAVDSLWAIQGGSLPSTARIFRSEDGGDTWTADDTGMTARNVHAFAALGTGTSRLDLAGTDGGVFARTPGEPWQADGLADQTVYALYAAPDGLLAGTDDGLFLRDAAGTWTPYGAGLGGRAVYAILAATTDAGPWLGVGTDAGLFETGPFVVAAETPSETLAAALAVTTSPNPARGPRTVRIDGAGDDPVTVDVFDLLGRRVARLGEHASAGARLDVAWDASALPPGVYVVRVTAGAASASVRAVALH